VHETTIRVRFDEVDSMGIVHHPRYLVYFEVARTQFLSDLGLPYSRLMASGTHLAVIETRTRYRLPARYEDEIVVHTRCTECGRTRIALEYEVRRGDDLLATGYTRLAAVTPAGRARRLPPEVRGVLDPVVTAGVTGE
jgi:acyl-CoA thioester hydrolase